MKKQSLNIEALQVQSFATAEDRVAANGTVHAFVKKTGIDDTNCSAIDACASARGCTEIDCASYDPAICETNTCESYDDACATGRGCSSLFPC